MQNIFVVIPVYNCEKYLENAVNSVLCQPYQGIQIILINDGSTDSSPQICNRLSVYKNIHVIHQRNSGVSAARNAGINYIFSKNVNPSKDDYIAFLDADDQWEANFFCEKVISLIENGHSLLGFQSCYCDSHILRRDTPHKMDGGIYSGGKDAVWIHDGQCFGSMLYSCQFLKRYGIRFVEGMKYSEDKIFRMQCLYLAEQIYLENRLLYYYRATSNSAIHKRKYGIEYYVPIIESWISSDCAMQKWQNASRGELNAGRQLASIYIMDMLAEHYQHFRNAKDVTRLLHENSYYQILLDGGSEANIPPNKTYQYMLNHPIMFKLKNYVKGCLFWAGTFLIQIPFVRELRNRWRYPVRI